jgi:transcriptional regulator with XRE-family HTH domain
MKSIYDQEYRSIIERLTAKRRELGITQTELSTKLGQPQPYISKIETYVRRLDIIETMRICEALGIDVVELIKKR